MVTKENVVDVLKDVYDPEIPRVNVLDLGLVYDVAVNNDEVDVKMTLTFRGCPMAQYIVQDAQERLSQIPGVKRANVQLVWEPPWTPERISPEGRKLLGFG